MAKFDFDIPKEFFASLENMNTDEIQEKMLKEAAPILESSMKKALVRHNLSGEMIESVKARTPKKTEDGWIVFVGPSGYSENTYYAKDSKGKRTERKYQISNAIKAIWIEYGTSKQKSTPFLTRSVKNANKEALKIMQETFNKEVE